MGRPSPLADLNLAYFAAADQFVQFRSRDLQMAAGLRYS